MPDPLIALDSVSVQFGQFAALNQIDFSVFPGERVALVGSSGAGKSTLIRVLNGTQRPTGGEVWVLGRNLNRTRQLRPIQRQIGTIYQQFNLVDNLRVVHNVNAGHLGRWSFFRALTSLIVPLEVETATKALRQVGIAEKLYDRTDRLSGGQQQRVAIARVLVQNPRIVLADEPISSLDPERSREIMTLLTDLCAQVDRALVISLHDVAIAQRYCDRMIGLRQGRIVFDAPTSSITRAMIDALYQL